MRRSLPQSFFSLLASVLIWGGLALSDTRAQDNVLLPPEQAEYNSTTSQPSTTLWPSTPGGNRFGNRIAVDGDTVLIGAPEHAMWYPQAGVVYVFTRNNGAWTRQMVLYANDGQQGDYFGCAVALTGNTAVVGACADDVGGNVDQGSAYVFTRSGTTWSLQQKLTASNGDEDDHFGQAVAVDYVGGVYTAVIGAPYTDRPSSGLIRVGNAYVFKRNSLFSSTYSQQSILGWDAIGWIGSDDQFGYSVAIEGNRLLIGAPGITTVSNHPDSGIAALFARSNTTTPFSYDSYFSSRESGSQYGAAVAMHGNRYVIGAPTSTPYFYSGRGAVELCDDDFCRFIHKPATGNSDEFGASVDIEGDLVVVGAPYSHELAQYGGWAGVYSFSSGAFLGSISYGPIGYIAHRGYAVAMRDGNAFVGVPGEDAVVVIGGYNDLHADGFE